MINFINKNYHIIVVILAMINLSLTVYTIRQNSKKNSY